MAAAASTRGKSFEKESRKKHTKKSGKNVQDADDFCVIGGRREKSIIVSKAALCVRACVCAVWACM